MADAALPLGSVAFLVGHDDDVVLDPQCPAASQRRVAARTSRWEGLQSDAAIVAAVTARFPRLQVSTLTTVEELAACEADAVVVISYRAQPSFAWYATFFDTLRGLEARGVTVYPSASFKELISSKAAYTRVLQGAGLPLCPTEFLDRADCVDAAGALSPPLVEARLAAALRALGLLLPAGHGRGAEGEREREREAARAPVRLVSKPSNADGGFGVAFWEGGSPAAAAGGDAPSGPSEPPSAAAGETPLLRSLALGTLLTAGQSEEDLAAARAQGEARGSALPPAEAELPFVRYLREIAYLGDRPHLLLQPLVPLLAQHFELKLYFLKREPFYASLTYGKEKLLARVARPSTDGALFEYLAPLLAESRRAIDALPPDGPHDPKILMRVDWGTGEPLVASAGPSAGGGGGGGGAVERDAPAGAAVGGSAFLKRSIVKRAGSLAAPQKRLKRCMAEHGVAPLDGPSRHFINEIEIHPGYYVDWDETPDETIAPLAAAYGEYLETILAEKRAAEAKPPARSLDSAQAGQ